MPKFPDIMIIRYYELDWIEITYSNDWSKKNIDLIFSRLEKEQEENKHLETYQINFKWKNIGKNIITEEEREKSNKK